MIFSNHYLYLLFILLSIRIEAQIIDWDKINLSNSPIIEGQINGFNMGGYSLGRINNQGPNISVPSECIQCANTSFLCLSNFANINGPTFSSTQTKDAVVDQSARLRPSILRFPGGTHSGWYHLYQYDNEGFYNAANSSIAKGYGMNLIESAHLNNPLSYCKLDSRLTTPENYIDGFINYIDKIEIATNDSYKIKVTYAANLLTHFRFLSNQALCNDCGREKAIIPMDSYDCTQEFTLSYEGNENLFNNRRDVYRFELYYKETQDAISRIVERLNLGVEDILYVEMGNEYYDKGTYPLAKYDMSVEDYARLVEIYSDRLKCFFANSVSIKIGIVTKPNTPWQNGLISLLETDQNDNDLILNEEVDAVIFHHYYNKSTCLDINEIEDRFECAKDAFEDHISTDLITKLDDLTENFPDQNIWITEWNMLNGDANKNISFLNTILHASFVQEYALALLEYNANHNNNVEMATHHRLGDHNTWSVIQTEEGNNDGAYFRSGAYPMKYISELYDFDSIHFFGSIFNDSLMLIDPSQAKTTAFFQEKECASTRLLIYYTNKTNNNLVFAIPDSIDEMKVLSTDISFVKGEHLFTYGPSNNTVGKNRFKASNNTEYFNQELDQLGYGNINDQFQEVSDSLLAFGDSATLLSNSVGILKLELETITVATEEINSNNFQLILYPNPASSSVILDINSMVSEEARLQVTDLSGQKLLNLNKMILTGSNRINLDFSQFPNGIYFISIIGSNEAIVKRIVIHR